jgi:hypothetical protein
MIGNMKHQANIISMMKNYLILNLPILPIGQLILASFLIFISLLFMVVPSSIGNLRKIFF